MLQANLWIFIIVSAVVFSAIGVSVGFFLSKLQAEGKLRQAELASKKMFSDAERDIETKRKEAQLEMKDQLYKARQDFEKETKDRRSELLVLEKRLMQKEENLDRKLDVLERKEKDLARRERGLSDNEHVMREKAKELDAAIAKEKEELQRISHTTVEEAKNLLLKKIEDEVRYDASGLIRKIEEEAKETAERKSREIISLAINRCAAEHTVETTVSVVSLPSDELKGRIIGREGRNIRALEAATGCDIIIDDTPEAVVISGFDPVRREVARRALEKLITDGRIHPARVEEVCEKVKRDLDVHIKELGEEAVFELGLVGIHPALVKLLGRLHYRTSYGQNVLLHSKEAAALMGVMAGELGLNVKLAKRIGLLHDIGKAVDQEIEGPHAIVGSELARKYGESPEVVHPIRAHHHDEEQKTPYAVLAEATDAISAARPGARRETIESYIKRLENLEAIANSFKGVEKSYAIQAGREIRVMVQPDRISDTEAVTLAREITKRIQSDLEYPGQIKVTVIRETRVVDYAK
ncbi:MAG: ribonuclease Y [Candidatus Omnitrophica bacterium]|nr:ribonuclease Y [Candidatus Omnitrophota bacterium]